MKKENKLDKKITVKNYIIEHQLLTFFILVFAITWGIAGAVLIFMDFFISLWGPLSLENPYYFTLWMIAVYGSPISAFITISITYGKKGLHAYLKRLLNWRFKTVGVILLISFPILAIISNFIYVAFGGESFFTAQPWYLLLILSIMWLVYDPGPMEELGWRGFALPLLQRKYSALWSSVILGIIWAIWHLPAFFIAALPQSTLSFPLFIVDTIAMSILMTAAYNKSKGSIPLAFLMHWMGNLIFSIYFPNFADNFISYLIYTILLTCTAVIVIILFGPENLGESRYTNPIPLTNG